MVLEIMLKLLSCRISIQIGIYATVLPVPSHSTRWFHLHAEVIPIFFFFFEWLLGAFASFGMLLP